MNNAREHMRRQSDQQVADWVRMWRDHQDDNSQMNVSQMVRDMWVAARQEAEARRMVVRWRGQVVN